jgi:hypothetical protein
MRAALTTIVFFVLAIPTGRAQASTGLHLEPGQWDIVTSWDASRVGERASNPEE